MILQNLLKDIAIIEVIGERDLEIVNISFDSRQVKPGYLFIATVGTQTDGHLFIEKAILQGAVAVMCEKLPETLVESITYIQVPHTDQALGQLAANFYDHPSKKIKLVGITGTNGKTTTVTLLFELFRQLGYSTGMLSTVQNQINEEIIPSTHTTPDAIQLNNLLAQMVAKGCTHCFMEVSSHAIAQYRVMGIHFTGAAFTNITHDHLDFHQTFNNYIKAKKKLFDDLPPSAFALVNVDDKRGRVMVQNTEAKTYTFALKNPADFKGKILDSTLEGLLLDIENKQVWFQLIGEFNAYNLLGVYAIARLLDEPEDQALQVLSSLRPARGRFEQLRDSQGRIGIVDYAHTPDALENVLKTIIALKGDHQKLITVIGCGGNRDQAKRPIMAKIACQYSGQVILTSDNPRNEDPQEILEQMKSGVSVLDKRKVITIPDRLEAIEQACQLAQSEDIILIAGKGHETYQEIKGVRYNFDDKKVLMEKMGLSPGLLL